MSVAVSIDRLCYLPVTNPDLSLSKSWKNSVTLIRFVWARVRIELWKLSSGAATAAILVD